MHCDGICVYLFTNIYLPLLSSIIIRNPFNNISLSLGGTLVCSMHDIYIVYVFSHTWVLAHMMLSIQEMRRNGIQHHAPPDDPYSLISLLLILLFVWFDFMPVNVTFVCHFLPMDSEND